jgi:putative membrane protein
MNIQSLPHLQAACNVIAVLSLSAGVAMIKRGKKEEHKAFMLLALLAFCLFMAFYLVYHYAVGPVKFAGTGQVKTFYMALLASHTIAVSLAMPLVFFAVIFAVKKNKEKHKKMALITFPVWFYGSLSGIAVYAMLYYIVGNIR